MGLVAVTTVIATLLIDQARLHRWVPVAINRLRRRRPLRFDEARRTVVIRARPIRVVFDNRPYMVTRHPDGSSSEPGPFAPGTRTEHGRMWSSQRGSQLGDARRTTAVDADRS